MSLELIFLGTGTSAGVPMIGCECDVCHSDDPRDRRNRCSVLVRYPDANGAGDNQPLRELLIDTSPDLRMQAISQGICRLDGVLYTHAHADHVLGLDELRRFNAVMQTPLDIYTERRVLDTLGKMFAYVFQSHHNVNRSFVATLVPNEIMPGQAFDLFGATWTPIRLLHGRLPILGFRVDYDGHSLAYCTDVSSIPPETYPLLHDLDVLVIDALRYRHHPTHMTVDQALEVADNLKPGVTYFTHIAHEIMHADLEPRLPERVHLAYDGLTVRLGEPHQASAAMTEQDEPHCPAD